MIALVLKDAAGARSVVLAYAVMSTGLFVCGFPSNLVMYQLQSFSNWPDEARYPIYALSFLCTGLWYFAAFRKCKKVAAKRLDSKDDAEEK